MRRVISLLVIFILMISILVLVKNVLDSYNTVQGLNEVSTDEKELKEQKAELEKELEDRKSKDFIESEARDKLGLSKKGETIYVPESDISEEESSQETLDRDLTNWELWLEIFK